VTVNGEYDAINNRVTFQTPLLGALYNCMVGYKTLDTLPDFFKKVYYIELVSRHPNGSVDEICSLSGTQWSTVNVLNAVTTYQDSGDSCFYIPVPLESQSDVRIYMNANTEEEAKRFSLVYNDDVCPRVTRKVLYGPEESVILSHGQENVTIDIDGRDLYQVAFYLPNANNAIKGIRVVHAPHKTWEVDCPYKAAVLDKLVNGLPIPRGVVLTATGPWGPCEKRQLSVDLNKDLVPDGVSLHYFGIRYKQ